MFSRLPRLRRVIRPFYRFLRKAPIAHKYTLTKEFIEACVSRPDPTILEIGCNDGENTLGFLELFKHPKIFCFEPEPRAIARFRRTVGADPRVELFEMALSESNGTTTFYQSTGDVTGQVSDQKAKEMPDGWDYSGSIKKPKQHSRAFPWVKFGTTIEVKTSTLDCWAKEQGVTGIVDFIWMDVQGAEMNVFKGAEEVLRRTRFLYTEFGTEELYEGQCLLPELLAHLRDFDCLMEYPTDALLRNRNFELPSNAALEKILADCGRSL